jgi:hypothetical protein
MPFSSYILNSVKISFQVMISMLMFPLAFNMVNTLNKFRKLNKSIIIFISLLIFNFIISNIFKLGIDSYTQTTHFVSGQLGDAWNNFTYSILITPIILPMIKSNIKKKFYLIIVFIASIILILSFKRIAILGLIIGFLFYFLLSKYTINKMKIIIMLIIMFIISFELYSELFFKRYEVRASKGRFTKDFYETELRFKESIFVWDDLLSFKDPAKSLFGLEAFNSIGIYSQGRYGLRNLHVDYNLIAYTTGLLGLFLYFLIYIKILLVFFKYKKYLPNHQYFNKLRAVFLSLFFISFITSIGGQMYHITFRMILFIYLGAILSIFRNYSSKFLTTKKTLVQSHSS